MHITYLSQNYDLDMPKIRHESHYLCSLYVGWNSLCLCGAVCIESVLLLVDFGFAHYLLGETDAAHNLRGSLLYMAPELLTRQQYNEKADLWSVGVILYG